MKDKLKCNADDYIHADDVQSERELNVRIAEHEHLLSFNSDWMAEAFHDWWNSKGLKSFLKYANDHAHEYL